jgi:hypothetical protein
MGLRTVVANLLSDLGSLQLPNHPRPDHKTNQESGQNGIAGSEGNVSEDIKKWVNHMV